MRAGHERASFRAIGFFPRAKGLLVYFISDSEKQHLPCSLYDRQKDLLLAACACVLVPDRAWSCCCWPADAADVLPAPCLLLCVHGLGLLASSVRRAGNGDDASSPDLATTRKQNHSLATARNEKTRGKTCGSTFLVFLSELWKTIGDGLFFPFLY
jgi:hypothetical protein